MVSATIISYKNNYIAQSFYSLVKISQGWSCWHLVPGHTQPFTVVSGDLHCRYYICYTIQTGRICIVFVTKTDQPTVSKKSLVSEFLIRNKIKVVCHCILGGHRCIVKKNPQNEQTLSFFFPIGINHIHFQIHGCSFDCVKLYTDL